MDIQSVGGKHRNAKVRQAEAENSTFACLDGRGLGFHKISLSDAVHRVCIRSGQDSQVSFCSLCYTFKGQ